MAPNPGYRRSGRIRVADPRCNTAGHHTAMTLAMSCACIVLNAREQAARFDCGLHSAILSEAVRIAAALASLTMNMPGAQGRWPARYCAIMRQVGCQTSRHSQVCGFRVPPRSSSA